MLPIHLSTQQIKRFYAKVSKTPTETGCLEWTASCFKGGYGKFKVPGGHLAAHRVAWTLAYGDIPDGMVIAHHCDNPRCTNSEHLFCATPSDNMRDMTAKGRGGGRPILRGEQHHSAKLTGAQVIEMRSDKWAGKPCSEIAAHFGISASNAGRILCRVTWTHIDATQDAPRESGLVKGERCHAAKLTARDIIAMRSDTYSDWKQRDIAQHFGITQTQVSAILLRKAWAHI